MAISYSLRSAASRRLAGLFAVGFMLTGFAAVWGAGCATPPEPKEPEPCDVQVVTLNILSAENINPNENGNPRPVVVRVYQLKNDVKLLNASYDDVLLKEKETLGEDLMKADEVEVFPNDLVEVKFERIPEASTLAGVALFHGPKGQSWKTFYEFPLPPGEVACAGRGEDAGPPVADPKVTFFVESSKIDNGSQFDESMFPDASAIRKISLPKKSAAPEGAPAPAPAK
jgi:type VI secretion system protein VasD